MSSVTSLSNVDDGTSATASTFTITTEADGEMEMTEAEISDLVHKALQKARQSSKPQTNGTVAGVTADTNQTLESTPPEQESITDTKLNLEEQLGGLNLDSVKDHSSGNGAATRIGLDSNEIMRLADGEIARAKQAAIEAQARLQNALKSHSRSNSESGSDVVIINNDKSIEKTEDVVPVLSPSQEFAAVMESEEVNLKEMLNCSSDEEGIDHQTEDTDSGYKINYADEIDKVISEEFKDSSVNGSLELDVDSSDPMTSVEFVEAPEVTLKDDGEDNHKELNCLKLNPDVGRGVTDNMHGYSFGSESEPEPYVSMSESMSFSQASFPQYEEKKTSEWGVEGDTKNDKDVDVLKADSKDIASADDDIENLENIGASANVITAHEDDSMTTKNEKVDTKDNASSSESAVGTTETEVMETPAESSTALNEEVIDTMEVEGLNDKKEQDLKKVETEVSDSDKPVDETEQEPKKASEPEAPFDEKPDIKQEEALASERKKTDVEQNNAATQMTNHKSPVKGESCEYVPPVDIVTEESDRRITFKYPYPAPRPLAKPRPTEQIKRDNHIDQPSRPVRWAMPKRELNELLLASRDDSLARRSNACGALKVLTMKRKNRLALVRTEGFLDSLISVANSELSVLDRDTALDARLRAVTALYQVSEEKDNREIICQQTGLMDCLVKVIKQDDGEARVHACAALAMLAKTVTNRDSMARVKDLVITLGQVVGGTCTDDISVPLDTSAIVAEELAQMDGGKSEEEKEKGKEKGDKEKDDGEDEDYDDVSSEDDSYGSYTTLSSGSSMDSMSTGGEDGESCSDRSSLVSMDEQTMERDGADDHKVSNRKNSSIKMEKDSRKEEFTVRSRSNACAALIHLSKHCTVSDVLAGKKIMLKNILAVCVDFANPINTKCIEIICNLTRFPANCYGLSRSSLVTSTLVKCTKSKAPHDRLWALRSLQNLSSDSSSKVVLATTKVLTTVSTCTMRSNLDEKTAAVAILYNLSTDAGAVVPMTNTKNVVATLVHLAHNSESPTEIRRMACDALATIGLWLQTLAAEGKVPVGMKKVPLPSHTSTGWEKWD